MVKFNFIGTFKKPSGKMEFLSETDNGHLKLNASVKAGTNTGFVELFGYKGDVVKTWAAEKGVGNIEIPWADRNKQENIDKVASFRKYRTSYRDENNKRIEKVFISPYDLVKFIWDNESIYVDKRVQITGGLRIDFYNGNTYYHYEMQNIYVLNENTENKDGLRLTVDYYWNKDSVDDSEWGDTKIMTLNGFVEEYVRDVKAKKYIHYDVKFDASKTDDNDEFAKKRIDYHLKYLKAKSSSYQALRLKCILVNGAVEKEKIDLEDLSEAQQEQIAMGAAKIEDFQKGGIVGDFIKEVRIVGFDLSGDYENGPIYDVAPQEDFEENVYSEEIDLDEDGFVKIPEATDIPFFGNDKKDEAKDDEDIFAGM